MPTDEADPRPGRWSWYVPATACGELPSSGSTPRHQPTRWRRSSHRLHRRNREVIGPDPDLIHPGQRLAVPPRPHRSQPPTHPRSMTGDTDDRPAPSLCSSPGADGERPGDSRARLRQQRPIHPGARPPRATRGPCRAGGVRASVRQRRRRGDRRRPGSEPAAPVDHRAGLRRPAAPRGTARRARRRATGGCGACAARCAACTCSARRPRPPRSACTCVTASARERSQRGSSSWTAVGAAPPSSSGESTTDFASQPPGRAVRLVGPPGAPWQRLYFLPEPHGHSALRLIPAYGSPALVTV